MNANDQATLEDAVQTWGANAQLVMVLEELAELAKEVAKTIRKKQVSENLADEIADTHIMLAQLSILAKDLGDERLAEKVNERIAFKMDRLRTRLADYKRSHQ